MLLLPIFFSSNVTVPKLLVFHPAVPKKVKMHLLRSKAVCSYNVRLSFLQSAHTFLKTFLRQMLSLLVFHPAVSKKIELRPFRSKFFSLIMFCSPVPKAQTAIFVTKFSRQTIPNKIEHVFRSKAL